MRVVTMLSLGLLSLCVSSLGAPFGAAPARAQSVVPRQRDSTRIVPSTDHDAGRDPEREPDPLASVDGLPWLELAAPSADGRVGGSIPLVEVRGRAGVRAREAVDVVLVFDVSESTLYPSGIDVDRDGRVGDVSAGGIRNGFGTLRPSWTWTTDPDDTIVSAELEAARRLLKRLETAHTRVGLVGFAGRARELCEVGPVPDAIATLPSIHPRLDGSGTNLGSAIRAALRLLQRSTRSYGSGRRQVVIVLSDGRPNVPPPAIHARTYALTAAERARDAGVRIYGYALGPQGRGVSVLEELSRMTGGEFVEVDQVGDVVDHLPYVDFGGITEVAMRNRTLERSARAVRLFGDGSFDGFVPLRDGENLIEVGVTSESGLRVTSLRSVYYDEAAPARRSEQELARTLRRRTAETELAQRMRAARVRPHRAVEIEAKDLRALERESRESDARGGAATQLLRNVPASEESRAGE